MTRSSALPILAYLLPLSAALTLAACAKKEITPPPPDPVATSIEITPTNPTAIDAIGDTLRLTARVLDQNGNQISGLSVAWTSDDETVATVGAGTGLVTGLDNGAANITATSGTLSNSVTVTVVQAPAQITKAGGDGQSGAIGALLGANLVAQVNDRLGTAMGAGVDVTFTVTSGGGSVGSTTETTDAAGQVSTSWTLGTISGTQEVTAALAADANVNAVFTATASAAAADSIFAARGNGQNGVLNQPLADSLVAKVVDIFGNGVAGVQVSFAVTLGGGAVSPSSPVMTDGNGEAMVAWTLGGTNGLQTVDASSGSLKGSPVTFSATGTALSISSITPNPMVEGGSATITGTGFDATSQNDTVRVDGILATVTGATATTVTFDVPVRDCRPADDVNVVVSLGTGSSPAFQHRIHPATSLSMSSGQQVIITDPSQFCLQFLPNGSGGDEYLVGVGATDDVDAVVPFSLVAEAGAAMAPAMPSVAFDPVTTSVSSLSPEAQAQLVWQLRRDAAESRLRQLERENFDPVQHPELWTHLTTGSVPLASAGAQAAAQVVPNVGDQLSFRVPDLNNFACANYTSITATVRAVGTKGIIATDNANPTTDSLTIAEINSFSSSFDTDIAAVDEMYFGTLTDLDTNSRVIMVLSQEVNRLSGVAGFVTSFDLFPRATCAASDYGEIFYGYVPDPANTTGGGVTSHQSVVDNMLPLISHEVSHIHQQTTRVTLGRPFMASWEAEGQADFAKEVVAHAIFGNSPGNDYTNSVVTAPGSSGQAWYLQRFSRLGLYFGWAGGTSRVNGNAPEECSLYGHSGPSVPCLSSYYYGSGWAFHRYIADRFGPGYSGPGGTGEVGLQRDWVALNNDSASTAVSLKGVENLVGVNRDTLFAQWAAMLYADGRPISGLGPELQMTSWDLAEIFSHYTSALSLQVQGQTWGAFTRTGDVRKGSTAYTLVTAGAGQRGALAIRLRNLADQILSSGDRPQLWVLRTK